MNHTHSWLATLILLSDYSGDYAQYNEAAYAIFCRDFIQSQPKFQDGWVRCRREPVMDGKEAGYWHCTSSGEDETSRTPDLRRLERIGWIRNIIENSQYVDYWINDNRGEQRHLLWLNEEYLVVLALRQRKRDGTRYFLLITAYCTLEEHRKKKLRYERDKFLSQKRLTPHP